MANYFLLMHCVRGQLDILNIKISLSQVSLINTNKKMLQVETHDDDEILNLYNMTHVQYNQFGGIQADHWLNLYRSLQQLQVDTISASDKHPGYSSQQQFVDHLLPELKTKLNIE